LIPQLIGEILTSTPSNWAAVRYQVSISNQRCTTYGDRELLGTAITQFIDNAAKYSTPGAPIAIGVDNRNMRTSHSGANVRHNSRIGNGLVT
jgi:K+-sensing histidine kinase KdpD